jgi:hypothetical protein
MTKNGSVAFVRDALGLSKNSLTSANVACRKPAPLGQSGMAVAPPEAPATATPGTPPAAGLPPVLGA